MAIYEDPDEELKRLVIEVRSARFELTKLVRHVARRRQRYSPLADQSVESGRRASQVGTGRILHGSFKNDTPAGYADESE
jgi:hypothetical protein